MLQISGRQACMLAYASQHFGQNLLAIMKGENILRVLVMCKGSMGAGLAFNPPSFCQSSRQHLLGLDGGPVAHAKRETEILMFIASLSPFSIRSAITRKARTSAFAMAEAADLP
jgi:hypothetical protein